MQQKKLGQTQLIADDMPIDSSFTITNETNANRTCDTLAQM